jgi:hypothetical protein
MREELKTLKRTTGCRLFEFDSKHTCCRDGENKYSECFISLNGLKYYELISCLCYNISHSPQSLEGDNAKFVTSSGRGCIFDPVNNRLLRNKGLNCTDAVMRV